MHGIYGWYTETLVWGLIFHPASYNSTVSQLRVDRCSPRITGTCVLLSFYERFGFGIWYLTGNTTVEGRGFFSVSKWRCSLKSSRLTFFTISWQFFVVVECTFIILDKSLLGNAHEDEIQSMVGDVNLFFNDHDDPHSAELEIMVAGLLLTSLL